MGKAKFVVAVSRAPTLELNGASTFVWALLDQGFWPHGLHTAPDDDALLRDIVGAKRLGFNALRKHIKVEPQRWYWWADWVGLLVLQDMPCARMSNERHTVVLTEATADDAAAKTRREHGAHNFRRELEAMVAALEAHGGRYPQLERLTASPATRAALPMRAAMLCEFDRLVFNTLLKWTDLSEAAADGGRRALHRHLYTCSYTVVATQL